MIRRDMIDLDRWNHTIKKKTEQGMKSVQS